MTTDVATRDAAPELLERVVIGGDLSKLTATERLRYYREVCASVGLNPLTKPFEYLHLNGKLILYARRDATDQLRRLHGVSIQITAREQHGDVYAVVARATGKDGRTDEAIGAVATGGLKGDPLANALMKAETKSKRRVTLSICGLGMLDETEVETVPNARLVPLEEAEKTPDKPLEGEPPAEPPEAWEIMANDFAARFDEAATREEANGWLAQWSTAKKTMPPPGHQRVEAAIARARKRLTDGPAR